MGAESPVEGIVPAAALKMTPTSNSKQTTNATAAVVSPDDNTGKEILGKKSYFDVSILWI